MHTKRHYGLGRWRTSSTKADDAWQGKPGPPGGCLAEDHQVPQDMTTWGCLLMAFAPDGPTGNDDDDRKSYFMLSFHYIATTRMVFYQWRMLVFTWLYHMKRIYFQSFPLGWCTIWSEPSPPSHQNSHFPFSFLLLNSPSPLALSQDLSWGISTTVCIFL